jgi:hypothetical protein
MTEEPQLSIADKFERVTNVRESKCVGLLVVESWDEAKLFPKGQSRAEMEFVPPVSDGSNRPAGYVPIEGETLYGQQVYQRLPR